MASSGITSKRTRFTGAEFIVHFLERQGIQVVTGIPGGSILPVYDALSQSTQIRHILARHEQGAGFIAQGMARTDGKPAVCMACSGPGATNLVTAIADARLDSIPLVCITGQVPASMIGTDAFQEVDTYGISIPITKHNYLVRHISELPQVMSDAFRIAQSGRPGPVWIDIPKDIQTAVFDIEEMPEPAQKMAAPAFSQDSIRDAAAMINAAKRPVLYLGGGVINAPERVREELTRLLCGRWVQRTLLGYTAIIGAALPELRPMFGCTQDNPHHCYDVWGHTVRAVGQVPPEPCLRWAMLLHDSGKPACKTVDEQGVGHFRGHPKASRALAERLLPRLRFSNEDSERILLLVEQHDRSLGDSDKLVRRRLAQIGEARFRDLLMIKKGDAVGQNTQPWDVGTLQGTEPAERSPAAGQLPLPAPPRRERPRYADTRSYRRKNRGDAALPAGRRARRPRTKRPGDPAAARPDGNGGTTWIT